MNNKNLFAGLLVVACAAPALAQTSTMEEKVEYSTDKFKVETNRFWSNWFITAGGGAQIYFGDHDKQCDFGDRIAPAVDVMVGKWFTPGIGVRVGYSGFKIKGATKHPGDPNYDSSHGTGENVGNGAAPHYLEKQSFDMANFHADVLFNFSNLFFGYNPERVWNSSPYVGIGWARVWKTPSAKEVSANIGWLNSFRISKAFAINVDVRGMFVNDRFDGEGGGRFGEGGLSATLGLTYNIGHSTWGRSKTVYRYDYGDLESMRRKLNEMSAENERMRKMLAEGKDKEARTIVRKIAGANLVTFQINRTKLSNEARANLGMLAEVIKAGDPDAVYTITGYADAGTGSAKTNQRLSKGRAENVYDCLVKEFGVNPKQLRIDYKGGVENMFYNDPRLSRAVITRAE